MLHFGSRLVPHLHSNSKVCHGFIRWIYEYSKSSSILAEFFRRFDHVHDVVEQVGVDDGHVGVPFPELVDGVPQQRVVEHRDLVGLAEAAGGGIVFRRVGIGEGDEDRRRASGRDHPGDNKGLGPMLDHSLFGALVLVFLMLILIWKTTKLKKE